jgi:hypothetical protein
MTTGRFTSPPLFRGRAETGPFRLGGVSLDASPVIEADVARRGALPCLPLNGGGEVWRLSEGQR